MTQLALEVTEHTTRIPTSGEVLLKSLSFHVGTGERVGITGPSGCGKTTLLRDICRATLARSNGNTIRVTESSVDYVGQRDSLFPWYTARQSLAAFSGAAELTSAMLSYAQILRIADKLDHADRKLSGGEKQRASLWTALCRGARFLMIDEPASALDLFAKFDALQLLSDWLNDGERSLLVVSHDFHVLSFLCDRIIHLDPKSGIHDVIDLSSVRSNSIKSYLEIVDGHAQFGSLLTRLCMRNG